MRGIHRWPVNTQASNAENVSIWWRHYENCSELLNRCGGEPSDHLWISLKKSGYPERWFLCHKPKPVIKLKCGKCLPAVTSALQRRYNGHDGVSNHHPHDCLLNRLFKAQIKENIKAPRHWSLWWEFTGDRWIQRPVMRKMLPFDDVIMKITMNYWTVVGGTQWSSVNFPKEGLLSGTLISLP